MPKAKKYPSIYEDTNGKYYYHTQLGIDPMTGKRIQKKGRTNKFGLPFKNAKEAYDEMIRIKAEFNGLAFYDNYSITFEEYMEDIYLKAYKQKVQRLTYQTAMTHHKYFVKYFGKKKLREISSRDCERFRLYLIENHSENYARNLWSRFKACLGYAERLGYIQEFPCKHLDNPKGKHPDTQFWTYEEFQKVIKTFDVSDYEGRQRFTTVWLYYMVGCRVSEGLSLKWEDIDFQKKTLHIHSTLEKDEAGNWCAKQQTKTRAGMRYIELDEITLNVLQNWRKVQVSNSDEDYVLSRFGEPLCKSTLSRILKRHAKIAEVPVISGKGLRHSHASYLINVLNKNTLYVSHRLGHADKSTTLNTYSHWYHANNQSISDEITAHIKSSGIDIYNTTSSLPDAKQ